MKKIIIILAVVLAFGSCDKGFDEMNVNPTKPTQISPATKLTYIQLYTGGSNYVATLFWSMIHMMTDVQQINITSYSNAFTYKENHTADLFLEQYKTTVKSIVDLQNQLEKSTEPTAETDLAIAQVQKVLIFSRLTDAYGDIPYTEAGKGYLEGIRFPKYDKQSDIYANMLSTLEKAVAVLKKGGANSYGSADLYFGGNDAKWAKFANSLMLRLALRMVKVDPDAAKTWAAKAIAGGVMTSNDDDVFVKYENSSDDHGPKVNPLTKSFTSRAANQVKISATFFDYLKAHNDPRIRVLCSTVTGDTAVALQSGQDINDFSKTAANSKPNIHIFGGSGVIVYDAPLFFQTYAEVEFMEAEAAVRWGLAGGNAAAHYNAGVKAAMEELALYGPDGVIPPSEITDYLAANPFDAAKGLEQINDQYWVATFGNSLESFSNWKRSGYPQLVPLNIAASLTGGKIPRRFTYPASEKINNPDNVAAAVANMGGDELTTRMWWDK